MIRMIWLLAQWVRVISLCMHLETLKIRTPGEKKHSVECKETYLVIHVGIACWSVHICKIKNLEFVSFTVTSMLAVFFLISLKLVCTLKYPSSWASSILDYNSNIRSVKTKIA